MYSLELRKATTAAAPESGVNSRPQSSPEPPVGQLHPRLLTTFFLQKNKMPEIPKRNFRRTIHFEGGMPKTASQTQGGSSVVAATRWRRRAGRKIQSPSLSVSRLPSSNSRVPSPESTATHSSSSWSYQKEGGDENPEDTIRSTRKTPVRQSSSAVSPPYERGGREGKLPLVLPVIFLKVIPGLSSGPFF